MSAVYSLRPVCLGDFVAISQFDICSGSLLHFYLLQLFEFPARRQAISNSLWIFQQHTWIRIISLEPSKG